MEEYSSFEIPFDYSDSDTYIRAVRFNMIRRNGEIKASAFKSKKGGVSVTRTCEETQEYAVSYMKVHFDGVMAIFPVCICGDAAIYEKHSPSPGHNLHHWELYGDSSEAELSDAQIDAIIEAISLCE